MTGTVKWFNNQKGFGFITNSETEADIFVHYTGIVSDESRKTLNEGDNVTYDEVEGQKGLQAANVHREVA